VALRCPQGGLAAPLLGHLDPEFLRILDQTCDRLRAVLA